MPSATAPAHTPHGRAPHLAPCAIMASITVQSLTDDSLEAAAAAAVAVAAAPCFWLFFSPLLPPIQFFSTAHPPG